MGTSRLPRKSPRTFDRPLWSHSKNAEEGAEEPGFGDDEHNAGNHERHEQYGMLLRQVTQSDNDGLNFLHDWIEADPELLLGHAMLYA